MPRRTAVSLLVVLSVALLGATESTADEPYPLGASTPEIANFLGADRFGQLNPSAPPETMAFGRLVGLWKASVELRARDGSWVPEAPALWAWQYVLDGFATQDLWFHSADHLPRYLAALKRPYLLTGLRLYEPASGTWRVAWAANGGGKSPGMDFGTLQGTMEGENLVLRSAGAFGQQRITFSEMTADSFVWTSEMSQDGESWNSIMRVRAHRWE